MKRGMVFWLLLGLSILGAVTYGAFAREWALHAAPDWARAALKTSSVAALVIVALSQRSSALLVGALALGAAGDALLALNGQIAFLLGALAFLIGHLLYVTLFLGAGFLGAGLDLAAIAAPLRVAMMAGVALAATVCAAMLWPRDTVGLATSAIYTLALTAMVLSTLTLPWARWPAMAGGVLFFVSDVLLTWQTSRPPHDAALLRVLSDASWFTYYFGQLGLCLGALSLRARA